MRRQRTLVALTTAVLVSILLAADSSSAAAPEPGPGIAGTPLRRLALVGNDFDLSTGTTVQRLSPSVAYNRTDNQYLVVWFDGRNPHNNDIFGQRVSAAGSLAGANIPIMEFPDSQSDPSVAYNSTDNQYLVAWQTQQSGFFNDVRGRRISASGALLGGDFFIGNAGFETSMAYNATANQYLVTGRGMGNGVRGQRVAGNGSLAGSGIVIATAGSPAPNGQVAYNPNANEYLATWRNQTDGNLQGQRISASGALLGSPIIISSLYVGGQHAAGVAFDDTLNRYLVVFRDTAANNVMGQFVSSTGSLIGVNFYLAVGLESAPSTPHVAYSAGDRAFVIVTRQGSDIVGRVLSGDGGLLGPPLVIAQSAVLDDPTIAYNSRTGEFLVAWADERNLSLGVRDIFARLVDISPVMPGDGDCDGNIDAVDAALLLQYAAGLTGPMPCLMAADVNRDSFFDAIDAALILQYVAGLIGTLPP